MEIQPKLPETNTRKPKISNPAKLLACRVQGELAQS
jgi:hypothetical protein